MFPLSPEISLHITNQRMAEDRETARRRRLVREARTADRLRHIPPGRPRLAVTEPSQRPAMLAFLQGLSSQTVYRRFFATRLTWSDREIDRLLQNDSRNGAVVALWQDRIVAHAMAAVGPRGGSLDLAVVVADDWQGFGVGPQLLDRLLTSDPAATADELEFTVLAENRPVVRLARRLWPDATPTLDGQLIHFRVTADRSLEPCGA
jgi:GNAT superfamily N-acetyltransferase